ncbi:MotA/TolQ/ExbB proton channel family protein [Cellvibrio japonicus]|nr:MotA/TolQ/ExbB proton channel family protein [Cellvibrio japonicus]QEI13569.1 MotA/TolQ/ExbB proton channel family protein [Cellvibrio japonicus]QEI17143.1 MotA/TolQ/ExbB proton channel family protein [Cellvibrio japonicus]QEI20720.1 MotA/TolQ/ExbB proton channel family protein [Cellvibrio japonicus]
MDTLIRFFQDGGSFMYPIAIVLVVGIAIAIERWLVLTAAKSANRQAFNRILPLLHKKDYAGVINLSKSTGAPIARIIAAGVVRMSQSPRRDDIELAMEEGVMEAMPRLEKRTAYLATLANISTLLGLLGTIIGLIAAFTAVANADPAEKAALLSSSIAVAMNTTAFGLISAIPLLLIHSMLQSKTTEIIDSLEMAGVKCLNIIAHVQEVTPRTRTQDTAASSAPKP